MRKIFQTTQNAIKNNTKVQKKHLFMISVRESYDDLNMKIFDLGVMSNYLRFQV